MSTLPASLLPSASERTAIVRYIAGLSALATATPADTKAVLVLVTKMLLALGSPTSELGSEARGDAYMRALEGMPAWAVNEAIGRWYRGDCAHVPAGPAVRGVRPDHDYRWPPAPAILKKLTEIEVWRVAGRSRELQRLLDAKPVYPRDPRRDAEMAAKLASLAKEIAARAAMPENRQ